VPAARRTSPAPRGPGVRITAPRLVGRSSEYELLRAAVDQQGSVTVVEGESGVGKTRLLAEVLPDVASTGRRVVVGGCRHLRDPFPLSPVVEALRTVGDALADVPVSPVAGALRPLLPELSDVLPELPPPLDDRRAEQYRLFRGLVDVLDSLGSAVLVLEDLHWADARTVDFLNYLLGVPQPKLAIVLTYRGEQVDPSVRAVTSRLPMGVRHEHLDLAPLDASETGELAAAILGLDDLSEEFASYLCERASGLPFAIEELLALLRSRGDLAVRGGEWARRAVGELNVPRGITDQVRERVSVLSDGARTAVEAAAVLQVAVPPEAMVATGGGDSEEVLQGVAEAVSEGLLAFDADRVGFRHVLAAQATYEGMMEPRRRDLHARAAVALESVRPVPLGLVAHHLRQAGLVAQWVDAAERAAERAMELGDDDEAVRLLRDVLCDAALDGVRRGLIAVALARAAVDTLLDAAELIELLTDVLERQDLPAEARGELRFRLGLLVNIAGGDPAVQRRFYLDAIDDLDDRPDLKAWAMTVLAAPTVPGVPLSEQVDWVHRALEVIPEIDDDAFEVFLLGKVAMVLAPTGDPAWRGVVRQIVERTAAQVSRRELNACYSAGFAACYVGRHDTAGLLLTRALDGSTASDSHQLAARAGSALAVLDYCRGRWNGLRETADRLDDHYPDHAVIRVNVEVVRGCLALPRGDLVEAEARLSSAVRLGEAGGAFDLLPVPVGALIRLLIARGRTTEAGQRWTAISARWSRSVSGRRCRGRCRRPWRLWSPMERRARPASSSSAGPIGWPTWTHRSRRPRCPSRAAWSTRPIGAGRWRRGGSPKRLMTTKRWAAHTRPPRPMSGRARPTARAATVRRPKRDSGPRWPPTIVSVRAGT
jgi:hypothetical protein